jgi:RNA-directed DNA polymerase
LEKFKQRVRELTNRNWGVSRQYQIDKLSEYLRGWINYFGIASGYQHCVELDHWIRRRMRMAYWRQWRKVRTRIRNLTAMGVEIRTAVLRGLSSKGPWRNAKTPAIQQALSLEFFHNAGLYSLRDGWVTLHYSE